VGGGEDRVAAAGEVGLPDLGVMNLGVVGQDEAGVVAAAAGRSAVGVVAGDAEDDGVGVQQAVRGGPGFELLHLDSVHLPIRASAPEVGDAGFRNFFHREHFFLLFGRRGGNNSKV
jgi:hypothetical protein